MVVIGVKWGKWFMRWLHNWTICSQQQSVATRPSLEFQWRRSSCVGFWSATFCLKGLDLDSRRWWCAHRFHVCWCCPFGALDAWDKDRKIGIIYHYLCFLRDLLFVVFVEIVRIESSQASWPEDFSEILQLQRDGIFAGHRLLVRWLRCSLFQRPPPRGSEAHRPEQGRGGTDLDLSI